MTKWFIYTEDTWRKLGEAEADTLELAQEVFARSPQMRDWIHMSSDMDARFTLVRADAFSEPFGVEVEFREPKVRVRRSGVPS